MDSFDSIDITALFSTDNTTTTSIEDLIPTSTSMDSYEELESLADFEHRGDVSGPSWFCMI
ncbi:hypothetical protein CPB84DRAFT_1784596, partial [Gymnopilus junonius]